MGIAGASTAQMAETSSKPPAPVNASSSSTDKTGPETTQAGTTTAQNEDNRTVRCSNETCSRHHQELDGATLLGKKCTNRFATTKLNLKDNCCGGTYEVISYTRRRLAQLHKILHTIQRKET